MQEPSDMPKVSVLLPVYNAEIHLQDTLETILNQTFSDFEILAIDDGSKDRSLEILRSMRDPRIRIHTNSKNIGISATLNRAIELANGEYLARMDSDDLASSERLRAQVALLDSHPDVGVTGSSIEVFGKTLRRVIRYPKSDQDIKAALLFDSAFAHPTVMIRKDVLSKSGLKYESSHDGAEDYLLWSKMAEITKFENLPEPLLHYRVHSSQISVSRAKQQRETAKRIREDYLNRAGIHLSAGALSTHHRIGEWAFEFKPGEFDLYLSEMRAALQKQTLVSSSSFIDALANRITIARYENPLNRTLREISIRHQLFHPGLMLPNERMFHRLRGMIHCFKSLIKRAIRG
jgi:glycosyltransferase involved in cell wall biosynthesis